MKPIVDHSVFSFELPEFVYCPTKITNFENKEKITNNNYNKKWLEKSSNSISSNLDVLGERSPL